VKHLVLIGMMGSGKTTVGEVVAERLGRPFLDSDREIERRTGHTVAELFAQNGEAAFRTLETEVLHEALTSTQPTVVAAAGGSVLDPANRRAMREHGIVVWLRADPELLADRVAGGTHRPLLEDDASGTLARLAAEREPIYREVAQRVIDVDDLTVDRVVDLVVASHEEVTA
jgi:shikimate kinase